MGQQESRFGILFLAARIAHVGSAVAVTLRSRLKGALQLLHNRYR